MTPILSGIDRATIAVIRFLGAWLPPLAAWVRRNAQRLAAQALEAYLGGNRDAAESGYRRALAWEPHNADLYAALGQVYYELGRTGDAEAQFHKALDYDYQSRRALQGLGLLLQDRGELDQAMYLYLRYLEIQPRDANVCLNLGVIFHNMGNYEKALEYYARAEKEAPEDPIAPKNQALALIALGRFEDAGTVLERARKVSPGDGEIDGLMGQVLEARGDNEGAAIYYGAAIQKSPGDTQAHLNLARVADRLSRPQEAVSHAEAALELFRKAGDTAGTALACWELGWAYYNLGDWDRSLEASTESMKLNPNQAIVRFNRALALLHLGRSAEAREEYLYGIDRLAQPSELKSDAIHDLSDALKRNPNLAGGAEMLAMLKEKYAALSKDIAQSAKQSVNRSSQPAA